MKREIKEIDGLRIQLLSYDTPTQMTERFYFLEMSTLQATKLIPKERKIVSSEIVAYTDDDEYLSEKTIKSFKSIQDFNDFFTDNPNYYIHDCDINLENGMKLGSHDDGEVSIEIIRKSTDEKIIEEIFESCNIEIDFLSILKEKPGHYIEINKNNVIIGNYQSFDDYLEKMK